MDIVGKMLNPALWPTRHDSSITSIQMKLILIYILVLNVFASDHEMEVNYDIGHYKLLQVNETLELTCKNLLNRSPPSWTFPNRLYSDPNPRMRFYTGVGESVLVISNAQVEDAGQYRCSIDHEYNLKTFHFNRTIEVIVNEIKDIKAEEEKDSIKLLCHVQAYPSATVIWKIVYDNEDLNPKHEDPDDDYLIAHKEKVVVDKSEGRWILRPYKGVKNAELIIATATENDNGHYSCVATNIAGDQSKDFTLKVKQEAAEKADHELEVNYDIKNYKQLHVNQMLELICKNKLNRDPPSWRYSSRLYRDPRMRFYTDVGESRLVISNATAEDAGRYECSTEHEYEGKTLHFNRTIEVMVNEIKDVKVEKQKDSIKLLCDVHAYPSATVVWKIVYDNKELSPQPEDPGEDDNWIPPEEKVVVDKTEGRWTLRPYKGINNAELIIADVTENDDGIYSCVSRNLAGEQSKDCIVRVTREAAGKATTAGPGNRNVDKTKTDNSKKVEGLGGGTITLIVLSSIFVLGSVLGTSITLYRKKIHQKKEEEKQKESQEGRSLPLIERNGASKA